MDTVVNMLTSFAKYLMTVDMFPVFFLAHFAIGNIVVREDSKHLGPKFQRRHPFASWFCTLITSLSGAFIANFLFGDPLLAILNQNYLICYFTLIWYLMNFSPFDIVYRVMMLPAVIIPISLLQECLRLRFLYLGIQAAAKVFPKAPLIILTGGIIKGNGYGFIKMIERLVRGHWDPKTNEFLELSYFAKSGVIASLLFLFHHYKLLRLPVEFLYLGILVAFIIGRLVFMIGGVSDPLAPIEAPICRLLFGSWEDEIPDKQKLQKIEDRIESDINRNEIKKKNGNHKMNGKKKSN